MKVYMGRDGYPWTMKSETRTEIDLPPDLSEMMKSWHSMVAKLDDSMFSGIIADWIMDNWDFMVSLNPNSSFEMLVKYMRACQLAGGFDNLEKGTESEVISKVQKTEIY